MISKKLETAINEQIKLEEQSARVYMAMASWCEVNGLPGAAKFLYTHSDEERLHMLKFIHFLNDRGGYSNLQALEMPKADFSSLADIFNSILHHEEYVTKKINELVDICLTEKDHTTNSFLQWFVTEQIEEESTVKEIVDKIKLLGEAHGGYFHVDMYLAVLAATAAASMAAAKKV